MYFAKDLIQGQKEFWRLALFLLTPSSLPDWWQAGREDGINLKEFNRFISLKYLE
jgi:hypothetical protein